MIVVLNNFGLQGIRATAPKEIPGYEGMPIFEHVVLY
jgi:hypothetical protein